MEYATNFRNILEAHERIKDFIHLTPILTCESINSLFPFSISEEEQQQQQQQDQQPLQVNNSSSKLSHHQIYFKCENFQKTGSFKARGALNTLLKHHQEYRCVTTHSSGNHGQALAWAASKLMIESYIVMPENAPKCKQNGVRNYGGKIKFVESTQKAREEGAIEVTKETGAAFVHPYDNPDVISGQGTIGLEFLSQVENLDLIIIPLGGGGFCSGVTIAAKSLKPNIKIIGAEPAEADDIYRSRLCGERLGNTKTPSTLADGLKANVGELTWPIIRDLVDDVITVTEEEIVRALRLIWERMKIIVEPSAAVGLAVALTDTFKQTWLKDDLQSPRNIGIILCGGNIDLDDLGKIFQPSSV